MNSDIYISASRRDFEAVSKIKSILHSAGYTYSGDIQSIQAASDFEQTIRAEIISSKAVLCVLSGNSSSSVYTEEDLRLAIKENKTIIPIIIDNTELVNLGKIGHFLLEIPVIRLNPYDSKSAKVILLHEIEKRCGTKDQKETLIPCANDIKNAQYDVFISCKSEDYPFAKKVYKYLKELNYNVFLANEELRKKGIAEYGKIIDEALDSSTHMIIIASKPEHIESSYVQSEWRTFIEEKRTGRKTGNIITIINFNISSLPISLRQFESFDFKHYSEICAYLPIKDKKKNIENINFEKQGMVYSKSNRLRDLSKHKGCFITITIAFFLCVVFIPIQYISFGGSQNNTKVEKYNESHIACKSDHDSTQYRFADHKRGDASSKRNTNSESSNIYSLTTNGIYDKSEAKFIIKFDCHDNFNIKIEAKIQYPQNNDLTYFSMFLIKKHIEGTVNNDNGKNIGYIDAYFSISENLFEIKGMSYIRENGGYKTIPFEENGELPTHIINKIVQTNRTSFE